MRAVLWTDTLQAIIILLGVAAVVIKGTIDVGGLGEVFRIGREGGRIKIDRAIVLATIIKFFTVGLCIFSGVVMYVYYVDCDPYTQGVVMSKDQIMPLMVMDLFGDMPGLPGLFLSAVVSASISTLSSGVNSLAALSGEDGVKVLWPNISPRKYTKVIKLLGKTSYSGAIAGLITSVLFVGWIKIGSMMYPSSRGKNSLSVEGCPVPNTTDSMLTNGAEWSETTISAPYTDISSLPEGEPVSK
eukprot:XP_011680829.1 PREDICTED: sodium-coupled monocarboxylate transporter 2-like [Strongylocentrotus purpuratus]